MSQKNGESVRFVNRDDTNTFLTEPALRNDRRNSSKRRPPKQMPNCATPVKHDEWLHKWHASLTDRSAKHYKTLRGFVIASIRQQL